MSPMCAVHFIPIGLKSTIAGIDVNVNVIIVFFIEQICINIISKIFLYDYT